MNIDIACIVDLGGEYLMDLGLSCL